VNVDHLAYVTACAHGHRILLLQLSHLKWFINS